MSSKFPLFSDYLPEETLHPDSDGQNIFKWKDRTIYFHCPDGENCKYHVFLDPVVGVMRIYNDTILVFTKEVDQDVLKMDIFSFKNDQLQVEQLYSKLTLNEQHRPITVQISEDLRDVRLVFKDQVYRFMRSDWLWVFVERTSWSLSYRPPICQAT